MAALPAASLFSFIEAESQAIPTGREYSDACRIAPEGGACFAQKQRVEAAYAEMRAALADPTNCKRLAAARDRFDKSLNEAVQLEAARIRCELAARKAEVEALKAPAPSPAGKEAARSPQALDGNIATGKDPFALPPAREASNQNKPDPFAIQRPAQPPRDVQALLSLQPSEQQPGKAQTDPFDNYKNHDRESSAVPVNSVRPGDPWNIERDGVETNIRRPGEEWQIERDGVPINVLRPGDAFNLDDASERLKVAGLEVEQQRLLQEMQAREAERRARQQREEAAARAEQQRIDAEIERQREREERREKAERNAQIGNMIAGVLQGYVTADAARRGVPAPSFTPLPGSGSYGAPNYGGGSSSVRDPQRASCERQVASATSRVGSIRPSGGVCQSARDMVRAYSEAERAYAGCQQYYAADYQATVSARREAEAVVASACVGSGSSGSRNAAERGINPCGLLLPGQNYAATPGGPVCPRGRDTTDEEYFR